MNSSWTISAQIMLWLALFGFAASPAWPHIPLPPKKGEIGRQEVHISVSDFTLTDQENRRFQFANTRGKLVLATFIFTSCPDVCPLFTAKLVALQRALQEKKRADYWLLSITTDPERDTPAVLKSYATQFRVDFSHWSFLTGSRAELAKVWKIFGVNVRKTSGGQIQHTALTTLIDREGVRRVNYWGDKWVEAEVLKDFSAWGLPAH
jgi:protein SCO1/2